METEQPHIILERVIDTTVEKDYLKQLQKLQIRVDDDVKQHKSLLHYCNLETLNYILNDRTLKCSSLSNVNLNDKFEAKRKNIERFAGSRFIACFSHCPYELVPFWANYGGKKKKQKLALKFKNFADVFGEAICMDYCITDDFKKMFFYSEEWKKAINHSILERMGVKPLYTDYDIRDIIKTIKLVDINYLPITDEVFYKDYKKMKKLKTNDADEFGINIPLYDPTNLGRHKTIHWEYEQETRIICTLNLASESLFQHIYLRLKEQIFQGLEIIMSPWASKGFEEDIRKLIESSSLSDSIKVSIRIVPSELYGQVKM